MIQKLAESAGAVLGYKVVGQVTAEDYRELEPQVLALAQKYDQVCLLLDLQEFAGEEFQAWLPDLRFGHHFHDKIDKMAIVGDKRWQKWLTAIANPFYAHHAQFFRPSELDEAWSWLREER